MLAAVNKAYVFDTIDEMQISQSHFAYSGDNIDALVKYLSTERLAAYFSMAKRSMEGAIKLYERNTELSEALYGVVQGLEVTLRNAVHIAISGTQGHDWYDTFPLLRTEQSSVAEARKKIEDRLETITPGRVVAELNFGFWVRLFSAEYDKSLWGTDLRKIVPIRLNRRAVYERLKSIKTLQNRIAHHNRIIGKKQTVAELYLETVEAIGWFSPKMQLWVETTNCVQARLTRKFSPVGASPKPTV